MSVLKVPVCSAPVLRVRAGARASGQSSGRPPLLPLLWCGHRPHLAPLHLTPTCQAQAYAASRISHVNSFLFSVHCRHYFTHVTFKGASQLERRHEREMVTGTYHTVRPRSGSTHFAESGIRIQAVAESGSNPDPDQGFCGQEKFLDQKP
jgi:hypothetical protein